MDYRDQDGNNEGLFGARNENSVLFSLDSLTALDNDSNSASAGSNFGSSGDASGLIDLNTLSRMSNSGASDEDGDVGGAPVMESMVFNQVVTKKKKQTVLFVILGFIFVIGAAVGIILYMSSANEEERLAQQAEQERIKAEDNKKNEDLQARIAELEAQKKAAEQENERRSVNEEEINAELARLREQQMNAQVAGGNDSGDSKSKGGKSGSAKPAAGGAAPAAESAPSAPKTKAPDKAALVAALKDANTKAAKCGKNGSLTVQFNLSNNTAKGVKAVGGSFAGTATEKCVLTVVEKYRWPDGTASGIKYPFKF